MKIRVIVYADIEMSDQNVIDGYSLDPDEMPNADDLARIIKQTEHEQAIDTLLMAENKVAIQINGEITEIPQTQED